MKFHIIAFALLATTALAQQQPTFKIADGSSSGMYKTFLEQIEGVTAGTITFEEVESHGAVENLDLLMNNKVSGAFLHNDVIDFRNRTDSTKLAKFKTLLCLFSEEVHFLAPSNSGRKTGGTMGFGAKDVVVNSIDDLAGLTVGASGGGFVTAQVIKFYTQIPYNVVQFEKGSDVLKALNEGAIDAAVFVGGAPLSNLEGLGSNFKLLSIPDRDIDQLKSVYHPATVTYPKMNPAGVRTVAAYCLLVSKEYKTPKFRELLKKFRETFYANLDQLQEEPGNHPKWAEVSPGVQGPWPWMDLGDAKPTAAPVKNEALDAE
jgi:TRAP-type uncharacterized transport system substrate-binding protein